MNILINGINDIYRGKYYIDTFPFDNDIRFNKFKAVLGTGRPNIFKMIFALSLLSESGKRYELDHLIFFEIILRANRLFIKEIQDLDYDVNTEVSLESSTIERYTEFTRDTSFYEWITINNMSNKSCLYDPIKIVSGFRDIYFAFD